MKTKLVYVRLDPDRIIFLFTEAKRRGISVDELVRKCIAKFIDESAARWSELFPSVITHGKSS